MRASAASVRVSRAIVGLAAVLVSAPLAAAQRAQAERSTPITVVTARDVDALPVCGRVFNDLATIPPTPALDVTKGNLDMDRADAERLSYELADRILHPLREPFCVNDRALLAGPMTFVVDQRVVGTLALAHPSLPAAHAPKMPDADAFYFTPVLLPAEVQAIRGHFTGTATVDVDGRPGVVLAQTPGTLYWTMPTGASASSVTVTVRDGTRGATFTPSLLTLEMSADQLHLLKGQSTALHAVLSGPDRLPASAWQAGDVSDVIDQTKVKELFPGAKVPKPGDPAVVFFRLENASRDTVSMSPSKSEVFTATLGHDSFAAGPYRYAGRIQSKRTGDFSVNGIAVAFFTLVAGQPIGGSGR